MLAAAVTSRFTLRLPEGWSSLEVVEDTIVADGLELSRAGLASVGASGEEVTGAAAERGTSPIARAGYELLERVATIEAIGAGKMHTIRTMDGDARGLVASRDVFATSDAPERWRYARSNGVALHVDWETAARRALEELVERDRVLRSWSGELAPRPLAVDWARVGLADARGYEWVGVELSPPGDDALGVRVVSVFGFPRADDAPLVFGHGARATVDAASEAAAREAMQTLAFLWGEELPSAPPAPAPTAAYHLDYWQLPAHRELIRRWLDGEHARYASGRAAKAPFVFADVRFVDLTPAWLRDLGYHLAKAQSPSAFPLAFGDVSLFAHLPPGARVHPIA